jgi:hypothetical protein
MKIGRLWATGVVCVAQALAEASTLSFDVASVNPATPSHDGRIQNFLGGGAGRVNWNNASLRDIIREAYRSKDYQISGPDWLGASATTWWRNYRMERLSHRNGRCYRRSWLNGST